MLFAAGASSAIACTRPTGLGSGTEGELVGDDPTVAHLVRSSSIPEASVTKRTSVAVVGGGIAGLSAIWRLVRAGVDRITLFELSDTLGGTARAGATRGNLQADTRYPWGAHYLPVPNAETRCVIRLCREMNLMQGSKAQPAFDALSLVHAPEDRLFYRGRWYDSLYLSVGATDADLAQRDRFGKLMADYQTQVGSDGRPAFALPAALSSTDIEYTSLDALTALEWMAQHGFTSPRLLWYCNYAVLDDYGASLNQVSAWSLLHYFAGRRPITTAETEGTHYFTWPEGNAHIVEWLTHLVPDLRTHQLVLRAEPNGQLIVCDTRTQNVTRWHADHIIVATPNHVASHVVPNRNIVAQHAPWLVANLALEKRPTSSPAGWNHVMYDGKSQGYIDAMHQSFGERPSTVWTWYQPLPTHSRKLLLAGGWRTLSELPLTDLKPAYGDLRPYIERMDIWRWGHGTVIPKPGLIHGEALRRARQPTGRIHFAHTDYSGLPLFEEANYRGVHAAEAILQRMGIAHDTWT